MSIRPSKNNGVDCVFSVYSLKVSERMARGQSSYRFPRLTDHIESRLWLAEKILGAKSDLHEGLLKIEGVGYRGKVMKKDE
jgi:hypothetical protein